MALKVSECGKTCPFFLCDNRLKDENCRCFLNPTLTTSMWAKPGTKTFPKNCKLKKRGTISVKVREASDEKKT
jgi:hypothetical protein